MELEGRTPEYERLYDLLRDAQDIVGQLTGPLLMLRNGELLDAMGLVHGLAKDMWQVRSKGMDHVMELARAKGGIHRG